jgi:predicted enzyme related to lactoylglutathione lyase
MLGGAPLIGFIPVRDLAVARAFYATTLDMPVMDENSVVVVVSANGTMLRLTHVLDFQPQQFSIVGWEVEDIEATVDALCARDVTFVRYDGMRQDARGIWETPTGDLVAWFADPDGNTLSLTSFRRLRDTQPR